jgi:hypothetical protein
MFLLFSPTEGKIFCTRPDCPGAHTASYTMGIGSRGGKRQGRSVDHPPHLLPRLKKEQSYTSAPPQGLRGLLQGELYLDLYLYVPRQLAAFVVNVDWGNIHRPPEKT